MGAVENSSDVVAPGMRPDGATAGAVGDYRDRPSVDHPPAGAAVAPPEADMHAAVESASKPVDDGAALPGVVVRRGPPAADDANDAEAIRAKARRQSEGAPAPVIPDCCNVWVVLRSVVIVSAAAVCLALATTPRWQGLPDALARLPADVAPTLFLSLATLCAVRRWTNGWYLHWQWVVGLGIPAVIAAIAGAGLPGPERTWGDVAGAMLSRAVVGAVCAAAILEYFRLRARAFAPSFSEARLQALQARIRPHFLFNSLNTVLGLIRTEPRRAEATLENLADLFRVFMRDARELVPLDDEIVTCREYLAIEQLRLGERLNVIWHIDEMPGDALLPSLLLQPLLENAVHHGIEPRTTQGDLVVRITHPNDRVRVEIDNPVSDTPPTRPGNQMALSNVRERLMLVYDKEAHLKTGREDGRFRLVLEFPYRKERRRRDVRRYFNPDR